jgi:5-methylcytosine-specific restriction endonuclease McrA
MRYNGTGAASCEIPRHAPVKAIFGKVALLRVYCEACKSYGFLIDGALQCCGQPYELETQACKLKREAEGSLRRKQPPATVKKQILAFQNHQCLYCGKRFGGGARIEWDHFLCFAYSRDNSEHNMIAACPECNRLKGAMIFQTVLESRIYIRGVRENKGLPNYDYFGGSYDAG